MNNKFGRDERQRDRRAGEPFGRSFDEDRGLRSPDQEFETSGPYRQPREPYGEPYSQYQSNPRYESGSSRYESGNARYDGRSSFDGSYAPPYGNGSSGAEYGAYGAARSWPSRESGGWTVATRGGYAGRGPKGYTRSDEPGAACVRGGEVVTIHAA